MTPLNPAPLANPFSERVFGNFNINKACRGGYFKKGHPRALRVPNQNVGPGDQALDMRRDLHVPMADVPDGDVTASFAGAGFIGMTSMFKCQDGTVIDMKTRRVVTDPNAKSKAQGMWNDITASSAEDMSRDWEATPSVEHVLAGAQNPTGELTARDVAYWNMAKEEAAKAVASMSDAQKKLMGFADTMFPPTRFVDESKRVQSGQERLDG